jgi:alpha-ketoglutarate-dependent taurine dioxygenase
MKKSSATIYSPAMELPVITRRSARRANRIKNNSTTKVEKLSNAVPPPTEETINRLNQLGKQYPFCVCYKHKDHDPL